MHCRAEGGRGPGESRESALKWKPFNALELRVLVCVCVCTQAIAHVAQQLVTHWRKSAQGGRGVAGQQEEEEEQWERGLLLPASWRHNRLVRQLQQCFINSVSASTSLSLPPSLSLLFSAVPFSLCHCCSRSTSTRLFAQIDA